jgi:hypothetical protein
MWQICSANCCYLAMTHMLTFVWPQDLTLSPWTQNGFVVNSTIPSTYISQIQELSLPLPHFPGLQSYLDHTAVLCACEHQDG